MTRDELIKLIAGTTGKPRVLELTKILNEQKFDLRDLISITFHQESDVAFRASWLLENVFLQKPEAYLYHLEFLLSVIGDQIKYHGPQRHYAKIVMHLTEPSAPQIIKDKLALINMEKVVEQLFDWLISPKVKIAVKAFAAEAHIRYPWIKDELSNQLQFLMRDGTAAIQSKGNKLLKKLGNEY
jgi:hypothetical protein